MARTTFNGPVVSTNGFVNQASTAALLAVAAGPVNQVGKQAGKSVVDLATGKIYTATGSLPTSTWVVSDGTTAITPA
jgi:hypothetical protein